MNTLPQLADFEYRSKEEINGLPLIHINIGNYPETGRPKVAKGVVAIGNVALGVVSVGITAFGIVSLGVVGLGVVSLATMAIGVIALGAVALGYDTALGVAVLSAKDAIGVIGIDFQFAAFALMFAATIALVVWGVKKIRAVRWPS